ncbi:M23 family metallopeptidase [Kocuria flava]|uniref:M23 family metallopeptidase n=1 Tax=Kocuria flava TaxID=446860 RepID=UPI001FF25920|nr:M23 family metallopeptidase [Kocuria flava]MCJ8506252.1 M23 family metallopeptidase [Kocuria flava]
MTTMIMPASGKITGQPGRRCKSGPDPSHNGFDIANPEGDPILAAAAGTVTESRFSNTAGNMVWIDHGGGWSTRYFHLQKASPLKKGQKVKQGDKIGLMGNTGRSSGPHLHCEIRRNGNVVKDKQLFDNFNCHSIVSREKKLNYTFEGLPGEPAHPPKTPKRVPDMLIVLHGRNQYRLITGDRYISITENFAKNAREAGIPFAGIGTADHEVLTKTFIAES